MNQESRFYKCDICKQNIEIPGPNFGVKFSAHKRTCNKIQKAKREDQLQELSKQGIEARKQKNNQIQPKPKAPPIIQTSPKTAREILLQILKRTGTILVQHKITPRPFSSIISSVNPPVLVSGEMSIATRNILDDMEPEEVLIYNPEPDVNLTQEKVVPNLEVEKKPNENPTLKPSVKLTQEPGEIQPSIQPVMASITPINPAYKFKAKLGVMENIMNFQQIRAQFLAQDQLTALSELYDIFVLSYIEAMGGYNLTDHKQEVLVKVLMRIRRTFKFLEGHNQLNKQDADLRDYTEGAIFEDLLAIIIASSMVTLSQREANAHEVKKILAEATLVGDEEKEELRQSIKNTLTQGGKKS